jgi:hypothetical protein
MMFKLGDVAKAIHNMQGAVDMLVRASFAADHPDMVMCRQGLELVRSATSRSSQHGQPRASQQPSRPKKKI